MEIIANIWLGGLIFLVLFISIAAYIEKVMDDKHPIKIWWRKYIISSEDMENPDPEDK